MNIDFGFGQNSDSDSEDDTTRVDYVIMSTNNKERKLNGTMNLVNYDLYASKGKYIAYLRDGTIIVYKPGVYLVAYNEIYGGPNPMEVGIIKNNEPEDNKSKYIWSTTKSSVYQTTSASGVMYLNSGDRISIVSYTAGNNDLRFSSEIRFFSSCTNLPRYYIILEGGDIPVKIEKNKSVVLSDYFKMHKTTKDFKHMHGKITVNSNGIYLVSYNFSFDISDGYYQTRVIINGIDDINKKYYLLSNTMSYYSCNSGLISLNAGDTVEFAIHNNSSNTITSHLYHVYYTSIVKMNSLYDGSY